MPFVDPDTSPTTTPRPAARPGPLAAAVAPAPVQAVQAVNPYDFTSDPLYQRIIGLGDLRTTQANSAAIAAQTQEAIDYGDPDLARSLGLGEDVAGKAAKNPFSITAGLARDEKARPLALDESLNKQNLFYSGYRGKQQSELALSLGQNRYNALGAERSRLGAIETTRLGALGSVQDQEAQAAQDAAARRQTQLGDLPQAGASSSAAPGTAAVGAAARPLPLKSSVGKALLKAATPRIGRR